MAIGFLLALPSFLFPCKSTMKRSIDLPFFCPRRWHNPQKKFSYSAFLDIHHHLQKKGTNPYPSLPNSPIYIKIRFTKNFREKSILLQRLKWLLELIWFHWLEPITFKSSKRVSCEHKKSLISWHQLQRVLALPLFLFTCKSTMKSRIDLPFFLPKKVAQS